MKTIFKIAKTELRDLFYSPIAWLILIIFTFQTGMVFAGAIHSIALGQEEGAAYPNLTYAIFASYNGLFANVQSYLYLYIPLLTMGLMSRELGSGSIKLLYSSPITNSQIILGKYVAMLIYGLVLIGVLGVYAVYAACTLQNADIILIFSGLLGVYLLLCVYVAIGLFMSSLTSYQIVAAVGTLAILAALTYVKGMWQAVPLVREIAYWFGLSGRAWAFVGGLVSTEDMLYFIVVVALFICMTIIRMQGRRQKMSWMVSLGKYAGIWILAVVLAYVSSRPVFKFYYDATQMKINTLTPNSQEIIKRATGGLTITTYVNILDEYAWVGDNENYISDRSTFDQYVRFKPEIKMKYVYYYDTIQNNFLESMYPGMTYEEKAKKEIERKKLNPKKVLSPEQIRAKIDLVSTEGNRTTRLLERESGERTFLRMFDDNPPYPSEAEISAALKRLVMDELPTIGFLTGHGERETDRPGDRNYCMFTHIPSIRAALVNQGFDYKDIRLDQEVPADVNIMVIAEMREPMTEIEKVHFDNYIARGGNLMIIGEPKRQKVMNPLVEQFGVKFMDGFLIQPSKEKKLVEEGQDNRNLGFLAGMVAPANPLDLIVTRPTEAAKKLSYVFAQMHPAFVITMPSTCGLEYSENKGFKVTPLLMSDSTCWNELETTDIVDQEVECNPAAGEVAKPYTLALALSRPMAGREQRIIVLGDADCLSDGEFNHKRAMLWATNYVLVQGGFDWLSNGEAPINITRPPSIDRKLFVSGGGAEVLQYMLIGGFPGLLLFLYLFIWLRRRGR